MLPSESMDLIFSATISLGACAALVGAFVLLEKRILAALRTGKAIAAELAFKKA